MCKMMDKALVDMLYNYDFIGKFGIDQIDPAPVEKRGTRRRRITREDRRNLRDDAREHDAKIRKVRKQQERKDMMSPGLYYFGRMIVLEEKDFNGRLYPMKTTYHEGFVPEKSLIERQHRARRNNRAECREAMLVVEESPIVGRVTVDDAPDFWEDLYPADYYRKDVNGETIYTSFDADCTPKSLLWDDKVGRQLMVCEIAIEEQERIRRDKLLAERDAIQAEIHRLRQRLSEVNAEISAMDAE